MHKRTQWALWEKIAEAYYKNAWRDITATNFTIRWGEIDLIVENDDYLVCVEVKTVSVINDIMAYVTDKKLWFLQRTLKTYLWKYPTQKQPRIDVVFVKDDAVWEVYENVTGN